MVSADTADLRAETTELLRQVRLIELQTARLVDQHLAGSYQSIFKGQGIAFAEVRAYEPGMTHHRLERHGPDRHPAREAVHGGARATVMLVVDMSGSLDLGSR